jgi:hypothetical protein
MLYPQLEPNESFRARREAARRRKRRRRAAALAAVLVLVAALGVGAQQFSDAQRKPKAEQTASALALPAPTGVKPRPLPVEIRGVHVTSALASLPGKLREYVALRRHGLNTIELDIKDEGGEVGFVTSAVPLAARIDAMRPRYRPREVAQLLHRNGIYLIGRIVTFQDPVLARARPDLAILRPDGSVWTTHAGLGWLNPYDRRTWDYAVSIAEVAARAGFDEIMFDYVRFPSDGDVERAVYPGRTSQRPGEVVADFVAYAKKRLRPLGVRVSAALFGLAATRDLRIGQVPRWISRHVDTVSPMAYPALYGGGELGIPDPLAQPGETVFRTLADFRAQLRGSRAHLVPWIQDFAGYTADQVRAQIEAARLQGAKGYLLWNPFGEYTKEALAPPAP